MAGHTIAPTKLLPPISLSQQSPGAIAITTTSSRAARHHGADWPGEWKMNMVWIVQSNQTGANVKDVINMLKVGMCES